MVFQRNAGKVMLKLFSPIPSWAQRRLNYVGEIVPDGFFSYIISIDELDEEKQFLKDYLWLFERAK